MEVPTPPSQHPALRPTAPYERKKEQPSDRWTKDKRALINWATGVLGAALIAGVGWTGTHVLSAESTNTLQNAQIKALEDRTAEDRALIREQFRQQGEKLDRLLEMYK